MAGKNQDVPIVQVNECVTVSTSRCLFLTPVFHPDPGLCVSVLSKCLSVCVHTVHSVRHGPSVHCAICVSVSSVQVSAPSSLFTRGPSQPVSPSSFPAAGADLLFCRSTKPWCRAERSVPGGHEEAAWPAAARDPQLGVVAAWPPCLLDPTWPARPVLL